MQQAIIETSSLPNPLSSYRPGGGRKASERYRKSLELCEMFTGLEAGFTRFDLLLLVKRAGMEAGFTPKMIQLLEYYLTAYTRDIDWEEGRPIVYQQLARTGLDLGVSEGQIQKLEKQLFRVGAIGYVDSGNCRRYGERDRETGKIVYAFGVDLSPLWHLRPQLEATVRKKELYKKTWQDTKRKISWYRRQIRSLLLEWQEEGASADLIKKFEQAYAPIAIQLRTHVRLDAMELLLDRHADLHAELIEVMGVGTTETIESVDDSSRSVKTSKSRSMNTVMEAHKEYNHQSLDSCSQVDLGNQISMTESVANRDPIANSGLQHVTLEQAKRAASHRLKEGFPIRDDSMTWYDLVEAANRLRIVLGISQTYWGEACQVLGRTGAALCLLVTDQAALREKAPVRVPAAYFRGMIMRARGGELRLQNSIFGLLGESVIGR